MARKSTPPPPQDQIRSVEQIRSGIERLRKRVAELEAFNPESVKERWAPETKALQAAIDETLTRVFGANTSARRRYQPAANLDHGGLVLGGGPDPLYKVHQWLREGKADSLALLGQAIKGLEEDLAEYEAGDGAAPLPLAPSKAALSKDVFVVHGRDEVAKEQVASVINRAGLNAVILHQQANGGATVIEKFEKHAGAVGFAVVIATPDDVGGLVGEAQRPRARQNVIGEMFWFAGRLGRRHVCALVKGDLEMPSDVAGIVYTPMDEHGGWKSKLLQELAAAGYENLNWPAALA
jgi:predicted nucleotide-binding protein